MVQYANSSTGNFKPKTARFYTNLSLFTVREEVYSELDMFNLGYWDTLGYLGLVDLSSPRLIYQPVHWFNQG